jgi:hypothetical protein
VASAFGYFNPTLVERMWTTGAERCDVEIATRAHLGACHDFGRRRLSGVAGLPELCEAAEAVVAAAASDLGALTLFAGYAAQHLPGDPPARAMQLVATLRELRGSLHLVAVVAAGVATPVAHAIRRPGDLELFGWRDGDVPAPSDEDRDRLRDADRVTDELLGRIYRACGSDAIAALSAGARALAAAVPPA